MNTLTGCFIHGMVNTMDICPEGKGTTFTNYIAICLMEVKRQHGRGN